MCGAPRGGTGSSTPWVGEFNAKKGVGEACEANGDINDDGATDLLGYAILLGSGCLEGRGARRGGDGECDFADLNIDGNVDILDVQRFFILFTGPAGP